MHKQQVALPAVASLQIPTDSRTGHESNQGGNRQSYVYQSRKQVTSGHPGAVAHELMQNEVWYAW